MATKRSDDMKKENNLEIERKFLLKNIPNFKESVKKIIIHQIYVDVDGKINRYRMSEDVDSSIVNPNRVYHVCNKKSLSPGVFEEIESEISKDVFDSMLKKEHRSILKTRHVYEHGGLKWEIDVYHDMKLVMLEVELEDINQPITIPEVIEEQMIVEVTGQRVFSNYNLSTESK
ncbi:MAG: hypothetical protein AABY15_00165 [Nanoarchaeota archaeon]